MHLSKLGLGTFPFSNVFSDVGQDIATELVDLFIANGGNYIETAPIYPVNKVDLAKILSNYPRDSFKIGSKCAFNVVNGEKVISGKSAFIKEECHKEIERLDCDYIDLMQTHRTPNHAELAELATALLDLKAEGLVKHIGLSNVSLNELEEISKLLPVEWLQLRLSIVHRDDYEKLVAFCSEHAIKLNVYQVIERGQLTPRKTVRNDNDLRNSKHEYNGVQDKEIKQWFDSLANKVNSEFGVKPEHLALLWAWHQKCVETCVVGVTKIEQLHSAIAASKLSNNSEVITLIEKEYSQLNSYISEKYQLTLSQFRGAVL